MESSTVTVNGAQLAYVEQGSGVPVVFVHGSLSDYRAWGFQMEPFAQRYRTIAYSRRCHWPNQWPDDYPDCAAETHASDLAALIDSLGLESPHVIGSSYGALTVLTMAAKQPSRARSLVLGEPPLFDFMMSASDGPALRASFDAGAWQPARDWVRRGNSEAAVRTFIDGVLGAGGYDRLPPPARDRMMDNAPEMCAELETPAERYFPALTCEAVRTVTCPVLLLTGKVSPRMFHCIVDGLAPCLPAAERAEIPDSSHVMHAGNPDAYNRTVLDFLARN